MDESSEPEIVVAELVTPDFVIGEVVPTRNSQTAPKSRKRLYLITIGIIAFVGIGVYTVITGKQEDADEIAAEFRNHPVVIEQLGGISECSYNFMGNIGDRDGVDDVYNVKGPKGAGHLMVSEIFYLVVSIKLRTESGEWELLD